MVRQPVGDPAPGAWDANWEPGRETPRVAKASKRGKVK